MAKHNAPAGIAFLESDAPLEGGYYDSEDVPAPEPVFKSAPASKFTPARCQAIIEHVEAGVYAHVAAQAAGVSAVTLRRWRSNPCVGDTRCTNGCIDNTHAARREFADALAQAEGQARVSAEMRVHSDKPTIWLRLGPGRDYGDPSKPGWTQPIKRVEGQHKHAHLHASIDDRPRVPIDLSSLSKEELRQLKEITAKLRPAGVSKGSIEIESSCDEPT